MATLMFFLSWYGKSSTFDSKTKYMLGHLYDSFSDYDYIKNFQSTVYFKLIMCMYSCRLVSSYPRNHKHVRNLKKKLGGITPIDWGMGCATF